MIVGPGEHYEGGPTARGTGHRGYRECGVTEDGQEKALNRRGPLKASR